MANPVKLSRSIQFPDGTPVQVVHGTGTRVNATAAASTTAEAAIPAGGSALIVRCTDSIWLRFGTTGMGAAAADLNSILQLGGEAIVQPPDLTTHFRVLRVGSADVAVQLETVREMATS